MSPGNRVVTDDDSSGSPTRDAPSSSDGSICEVHPEHDEVHYTEEG